MPTKISLEKSILILNTGDILCKSYLKLLLKKINNRIKILNQNIKYEFKFWCNFIS